MGKPAKKDKEFTIRFRATCTYDVTVHAPTEAAARRAWQEGTSERVTEIDCTDAEILKVTEEQ